MTRSAPGCYAELNCSSLLTISTEECRSTLHCSKR